MSKFDITDWSDFVRGVASPGVEGRMRSQLNTDPRARQIVEALGRVAALGKVDHEERAPEHAIRIAKAIAAGRRPAAAREAPQQGSLRAAATFLRRLRCTLAFDSRLQPAAAGTREIDTAHRQVVFEADDYRIDVRLEEEIEPRSTLAVGQVRSRGEQAEPLARVPVLVFAGKDEVAHALTSRFGEFQFEGLPRRPLELCLVIGEDFLEVPLEPRAEEGAGV